MPSESEKCVDVGSKLVIRALDNFGIPNLCQMVFPDSCSANTWCGSGSDPKDGIF